ncbi:MAG TPA: hypothetical protein VNR66_15150 [Solirubrobacteraceae bacterium]|nr:hypothetical protein [Solirubrobacteraceae bacterium]
MRLFRISRVAVLALVAGLVCAGGAYATVIGLPFVGSQVNNDPANGIDPNQDAGLSDVVGGSLTAGGPRVPWGTFEQKSGSSQQIFVRAFKNGQWVTQGKSLNIDPNAVAEAPSIDFAGAGRTVPWDSWYEPNQALGGEKQIFASRFNAAANTWVPEGQDRGSGVPSLNIHTNKEAENPSVAGGATVPGNDPVPWVAWQEQDGNVNNSGNHDQIIVSKGVKQATLHNPCTGFKPSSAASVSAFCWQQVGADRLAADGGSSPNGDPSLNADPSRDGIEPDITFTGANDKVAWTVWYEVGDSHLGLRNNDQVFAAKIVGDNTADGGFHWQAVGNGTAGQTNPLDTSSNPPGFGHCATSTTAEDQCSLNANPQQGAEDPRVATGTLTPGSATVPWIVWAEDTGNGKHAIFISRLVNGDHFELFNGGQPLSPTNRDSTHPDITFFGNVPYVSWIEAHGDGNRGFVGHFENGVFVLDTPDGIGLSPHGHRASLIDARVPLSSNCTADPFTNDGQACLVAAVNAPFDLFTTTGSPQRLFSQAIIGGPNCILFRSCRLSLISAITGVVIQGNLAQSNSVGILVQRIVGTRRVHGKRVLVLRAVGRVPLGHHHKGQLKIRWNLNVNGHRLARGRYLITLRAFDSHRNLLGHTNSVILTVKH